MSFWLFRRPSAYSITITRKLRDILNPHPDDIDVNDIAHALARKCRWNGHTTDHVSVAQHAVMVAADVEYRTDGIEPMLCLAALHHDDEEYVFPDVNGQIKHRYKDLLRDSERMSRCIYMAFGIPWHLRSHRLIKAADQRSLAIEARDQMGDVWSPSDERVRAPRYEPWSFETARDRYLEYHYSLMRRVSVLP